MKTILGSIIIIVTLVSCSASRKIRTNASSISPIHDTLALEKKDTLKTEAARLLYSENGIPFQTFSAKVKVEYQDENGKQPDVNAFVRMKKDQAIWISVAATFLNIEGFRVLITPDSVVVMNKLEKTIEEYPFSYLQSRISIPVSFNDVQELVAGRAAMTGDSIGLVKSDGNYLEISLSDKNIDNIFYYTLPRLLLAKQSARISQPGKNYTANMLYEDYSKTDAGYFSTSRDVRIPEKQQHIFLSFKQIEFNKELSLPFNRPDGYTVK